MFRIDSDGAVVGLETPAAVGATVGYFTEGDPGTGTVATKVSSDWCNAIQEEIVQAILGTGAVLDKTVQTQLKKAIKWYSANGDIHPVSSADYTVLDTDGYKTIEFITSNTNRTLTLPTLADNQGRVIEVVKTDSGTGNVIIDGEGSETIEGALTISLYAQYEKIILKALSGGWIVLECVFKKNFEFAQSTMTNFPAASSVYGVVQQVDLPIGKWNCGYTFNCDGNGATFSGFNTVWSTSNGDNTTGSTRGKNFLTNVPATSMSSDSLTTTPWLEDLAAATTYYLKLRGTYTGGTPQYSFYLKCSRVP